VRRWLKRVFLYVMLQEKEEEIIKVVGVVAKQGKRARAVIGGRK
jgi:hypothetical protein